ncbi:hypothetical protein [Nocardia pseudobrasiliensis]|nr:hypothetical protein [Nocardia pseudobrasiliensis]
MREIVCGGSYPQAMVRVGVPTGGAPLPETPRRRREDVVRV